MHSDTGGKSRRPHHHARPTPALDLRQVSSTVIVPPRPITTLFDQGTQLHYELGPRSVPVFHLEDQWDPLQFYERVRPLGERYGAIKVRLDGKKKAKTTPHLEQVWFRARTQSLRSSRERRQQVLAFHRRLYECHSRLGHHPQRVPSIDKRTLDLYRLWQCVQVRGGYQAVCEKKLWAQMGRELGYSGRVMSSLSTSLRSAYVKVLLDLEAAEGGGAGGAGAGVYRVAGSADERHVLRDFKRFKGLPTNSGRAAADTWLAGMEVYDASQCETTNSPVYSLKQYYEKSLSHLEWFSARSGARAGARATDTWDQDSFEKWYFDVLANPQEAAAADVDTGMELCPATHNFAGGLDGTWNLGHVPLHEQSLLRFLDVDWSNLTRPAVDVGMLFSTRAWSVEPMCLPSLSYSHLGSAKLWYVVAPEHREKFERLVQALAGTGADAGLDEAGLDEAGLRDAGLRDAGLRDAGLRDAGLRDAGLRDAELCETEFASSDIYKSFLETCRADAGGYVTPQPPPQVAPHVLEAHGIELLRVTQECGTFVFKFPQAYSCTVDSSFCVSERARFAPASWLDHLRPAPLLPFQFQFLMNIALKCHAQDARAKSTELLKPLIRRELHNRHRLNGMASSYAVVDNKFDFVSDVSLTATTGASKVVVRSDHAEQCVALSLDEFFQHVAAGGALRGGRLSDDLDLQLHVYYRDAVLQAVLGGRQDAQRPDSEDAATLRDQCLSLLNGLPPPAPVEMGSGFNLVELQDDDAGAIQVESLHRLQLALQSCPVGFPEMGRIFQLCAKVSGFQSRAQQALRGDKKLQELKQCYSLGRSCRITGKFTRALAFWICRLEWLRVYEETFVQRSNNADREDPPNYSLRSMEWFLAYGAKYCSPEDLQKLNRVRSSILRTRAVSDRITEMFRAKGPGSRILVRDISSVLDLIQQERLPIRWELVQVLRSIVDSIARATGGSHAVNQPCAEELQTHVRRGAALESLRLFSAFDGGPGDKRLCMRDVAQSKIWAGARRACKLWLADVSKLCGRGGSLHKFAHCVSKCLDIEVDTYGGDKVLYCFCRGDDIAGTMVECEVCKEWYHTRCIRRGSWKPSEETVFVCSLCSGAAGAAAAAAPSDDAPPRVVEYSAVAELVIRSVELKLLPDRDAVSNLFDICGKMLVFRQMVESELFKNGTLDANVPVHKIKHFLRKAQGSKCAFGNLTRTLQDRCTGSLAGNADI